MTYNFVSYMSLEQQRALVGHQEYLDARFLPEFEQAMMMAAREVSTEAVLLPDAKEVIFLRGTNNSPYRGAPKRCAEMDILSQIDELTTPDASQPLILDFYIAGPDDPALSLEVNGLESSTLDPCADCRGLMCDHPAVEDTTRFITFGVTEGGIVEYRTKAELDDRYADLEPPLASLFVVLGHTALNRAA